MKGFRTLVVWFPTMKFILKQRDSRSQWRKTTRMGPTQESGTYIDHYEMQEEEEEAKHGQR